MYANHTFYISFFRWLMKDLNKNKTYSRVLNPCEILHSLTYSSIRYFTVIRNIFFFYICKNISIAFVFNYICVVTFLRKVFANCILISSLLINNFPQSADVNELCLYDIDVFVKLENWKQCQWDFDEKLKNYL